VIDAGLLERRSVLRACEGLERSGTQCLDLARVHDPPPSPAPLQA
jgi:hypothetical protein